MLSIALALIAAIAVTGLIAFLVLCLGIRHEDRATLHASAPGFAARQARRFTGLRTERPKVDA